MTTETYKNKKGETRYRPVFEDASEFSSVNDDMAGFCVRCGNDASNVEPDARCYTCEACQEPGVYGVEELLMMGIARLTA